MLRMAHRILSSGVEFPVEDFPVNENEDIYSMAKGLFSDMRVAMQASPNLILDNVAEMMFSEGWEARTAGIIPPWELPCIKAPYDLMWCEYNIPESYLAGSVLMHRRKLPADDIVEYEKDIRRKSQIGLLVSQEYDNQNECIQNTMLFTSVDGVAWASPCGVRSKLSANGSVARENCNIICKNIGFFTQMCPFYLGLALSNQKALHYTDVTKSHGPSDKWLRRKKSPRLTYRILEIKQHAQATRGNQESKKTENNSSTPLHEVRGHFATYTENAPLFGHFVGTVWKPSHARGDIKNGAVIKDYSVSPQQ